MTATLLGARNCLEICGLLYEAGIGTLVFSAQVRYVKLHENRNLGNSLMRKDVSYLRH